MSLLLDRTGRGRGGRGSCAPEPRDARRRSWAQPIRSRSIAPERLGTILWHLGKTEQAEAVLRKNVDDRRRVLKPEHPDTLRSVYVLSRVLRELKRFVDAEQFAFAYAHSIQCSLGSNHPDYVVALDEPRRRLPRQGRTGPGRAALRSGGPRSPRAFGRASSDHPCGVRATRSAFCERSSSLAASPDRVSLSQRTARCGPPRHDVIRLVAALPLDIAAHARALVGVTGLPASTASSAALRSLPVTATDYPAGCRPSGLDRPASGTCRRRRNRACRLPGRPGRRLETRRRGTETCSRPRLFPWPSSPGCRQGESITSLELMPTTATPLAWYSLHSRASSWRTCLT